MGFMVSESEPLTCILGAVAMLMALVLAWRGYRFIASRGRGAQEGEEEARGALAEA